MGSRKIIEYFCDRCGKVLNEKPNYGDRGAYQITASSDYGMAGGVDFDWNELCKKCNDYVGSLIDRIKSEKASS